MSAHPRWLMLPSFSPLHPYRLQTSAHPRSLMPTSPSPHPFPTSLALVPSANVRASTLAHAHRSFSLHYPFPTFPLHTHTVRKRPRIHAPISNLFLAPTPSTHVRAPTRAHAHWPFSPPISNFSLHPHRPHTSAHPRSLMPTGTSPRPFPTFSLHPNCRHTSAHPRSLMPVLLPTHLTFPLHPHRLQKTSAHPRSLMPIGPSPDLFPTVPLHPTVRTHRRIQACSCPPALLPTHFPFPLHKLSAHLPASTLAHAHRSFPPLISNVPSTHTLRTHPRIHPREKNTGPFSPPISNLSLAPTPSAHACASTLPHAHRSFSPHHLHTSAHPRSLMPTGPSLLIFNFSVAPALSAHIRAHRPFSPPISNLSLTHTVLTRPRIHALMPTGPSPTHFQPIFLAPCARVSASTLAHAHRPFSQPISNLSLAPASSAHVCAPTLADAHRCFSPPI